MEDKELETRYSDKTGMVGQVWSFVAQGRLIICKQLCSGKEAPSLATFSCLRKATVNCLKYVTEGKATDPLEATRFAKAVTILILLYFMIVTFIIV